MDTDPNTPDNFSRATVINTPNKTLHSEILVTLSSPRHNIMGYINSSVQVPDDVTNVQKRKDKLNLHAILASISETIVPFIASSKTSNYAWTITQKAYANKSRTRIMSLKERISVIKRGEQIVSKYLQQICTTAHNFYLVGSPILQDDLILYILDGVFPDYKEIIVSIKAHDTCISFEDLHAWQTYIL
uniref:Uncharacterized protein n=1 Tax=Solanum lycopersicum TaxID=4081 RepID=K4B587_SOLLC